MQQNASNQENNNNTNDSSSMFMSDELGRANEFISSLTEQEIRALNASYNNGNNNRNTGGSPPNKPDTTRTSSPSTDKEGSSSQDQEDPYPQLFPMMPSTSTRRTTTTQGGGGLFMMPTPIGGSCQIVSTKDQVPLNQSLISQSNSLAQMFHQPTAADYNCSSATPAATTTDKLDSLFPNLSSSIESPTAAGGAGLTATTTANNNNNNNKIAEADFGSSASSPLIAAAAAAASPRANALPLAFQQHAASLVVALPPSQVGSYPGSHNNGNNMMMSPSTVDDFDSDLNSHHHHHHRSQQSTRWKERYQELIQYKKDHGDCNVPYLWGHNRPLSEWVKRQRHQYKLKKENKHSALTDDREALLTQLGFVWNSRASLWDGRFQELVSYYHQYGNLKVSKRTAKHRALSVWLKRQRHACRLFMAGDQTTCMTDERMQKLLELGVKITKKT